MRSKSMRRNRRRFLKQAGLLGGTGALVALIQKSGLPADGEAAAFPHRKCCGYRVTAHIHSYYKKAGL
jgi:hypothetical protein